MTGDRKFTMLMTEKEKEEFKRIAKDYRFNTISTLFRESVKAVLRNPEILFPTEKNLAEEVKESIQKSTKTVINVSENLKKILSRLEKVEKLQEWIIQKLGITDKERLELLKKDMSGEVIFEE